MPVPQTVLTLIENFERNLDAYRNGKYNETQVRRDFIDPFFKALGWDMDNSLGYAEAYRDVIHEDAIKVGISTRAPDYSFRIGGQRKYFLEAKKPSVSVKDAVEPAFQLRRYAWSAKLPLSIVTDFEEFAIYDCRQKPDKNDKASKSRLFYCTFRDYPEKWDEIAEIFSKDAVLKGSFDKYAVSTKGKRGTTEVDSAFLAEIEGWRDLLARNIALRNSDLSQRELNFAVQQTIDRIIFLRICEDRGIEPYGRLMALQNGGKVYDRLRELFREADDRYNSGLFHFSKEKNRAGAPDELTLHLEIDDKPLKEIFKNLYYPDCPYEFSVLGADILGSVYEQFLGKVIRLTSGNRAVVEDKPEVKKAGGVFYTPAYIVQYIVQHTVGTLLEGKTSKQAAGIRVVDPACGSGSFLIGAYQYLLDWHLARYVEEGAEKHSKGKAARIHPAAHGEWRLTTAEKKRILLDHIYGVDIDTQAVEVTKLSLLLKVLEGESGESLNSQMKLFRERVLPDLDRNIQCGNSLIGPDFYDSQLALDEEAAQRINVFDWQAAFPQIFKAGGFDAVIGNPPYVLLQDEFRDDRQLEYFRKHLIVTSFKVDTYHLFFEKGLFLLRKKGLLGFITPSNYLTNNHLITLRRLLLSKAQPKEIIIVDGGVFKDVSVDTAITIFERIESSTKPFPVRRAVFTDGSLTFNASTLVNPDLALKDEHVLLTGSSSAASEQLWKQCLETSVQLGSIAFVNFGKQLRDRKLFQNDVIDVPLLSAVPETHRPCFTGRDINRYNLRWGNLACLDDTTAQSGGCWDTSRHQSKNKLLTRQIGRTPVFALDRQGFDCLNTIFMVNVHDVGYKPEYLIGVLNSKLLAYLWLERFYDKRGTFPKIKGTYLKLLPIRKLNHNNKRDCASQDSMVSLVNKMLALHQQLAAAKTPQDTTLLQRQIAATDKQIDQLVYTLYGLTDDEIALVEGG
jgi:type I restriction-modification system DNA methylase subunit